jgi:hypothetical protein
MLAWMTIDKKACPERRVTLFFLALTALLM